jgi:hypothetical protein
MDHTRRPIRNVCCGNAAGAEPAPGTGGLTMATFKMPLSGDVVQSINPFTAFFSPVGSQFSVVNINLGQSSDPDVEREVLSDVGTYGRQIGRIGDALIVLLGHFHPQTPLTSEETVALDALKEMLDKVADVKQKHARQALRPYAVKATARKKT